MTSDKVSSYEEVYGLLLNLEEELICLRQNDVLDVTESSINQVRDRLLSQAVLLYLGRSLPESFTCKLKEYTNLVKDNIAYDRASLFPFVVGLYIKHELYQSEKKDVWNNIDQVAELCLSEQKRPQFAIEYLFSASIFFDLIDTSSIDKNQKATFQKYVGMASTLIGSLSALDPEGKAKLLYALTALKMNDELVKVYHNSRSEIEGLRNVVKDEETLAILLKPYMSLNVPDNRDLVFTLRKYFSERNYDLEERRIGRRVTESLITGTRDIEIVEQPNGRFSLNILVTENAIVSLQKQAPSISFISKIALMLCTSGFDKTYTVLKGEMAEYSDFKKSQTPGHYIRIGKKGYAELVDDAVQSKYDMQLIKGSSLLVVGLAGSIAAFIISPPDLSIISIVPLLLLLIISIIPDIVESGFSLVFTIIRKEQIKKNLRKELEATLED